MTYNSLVSRVQSYLKRKDADTIARIPDFIDDAQQNLLLACKTIGQESSVVSNFIPGVSVYQKPAGWRRNISINVGSPDDNGAYNVRNTINLRTYEFLRNYTPNSADTTKFSIPLFYSDYTYSNFLVSPTPDQAYPFEFFYMGIPPITLNNQTNWWTGFAPQVLFSAVMTEAHFFLENFDKAQAYQAKAQVGIDLINTQDDMRIVDRASARQAD
jgi:hypothetical protein